MKTMRQIVLARGQWNSVHPAVVGDRRSRSALGPRAPRCRTSAGTVNRVCVCSSEDAWPPGRFIVIHPRVLLGPRYTRPQTEGIPRSDHPHSIRTTSAAIPLSHFAAWRSRRCNSSRGRNPIRMIFCPAIRFFISSLLVKTSYSSERVGQLPVIAFNSSVGRAA